MGPPKNTSTRGTSAGRPPASMDGCTLNMSQTLAGASSGFAGIRGDRSRPRACLPPCNADTAGKQIPGGPQLTAQTV